MTVELDAGYPYAQLYATVGKRLCCLEPMTAATDSLVRGDITRSSQAGRSRPGSR